MSAYYNEIDPYAAQWLRNLITAGHIAPGIVDERSIEDVQPRDLHGFTQCHFFAGIGVWSHALRNSGWSDDRPVWTGSCPCQPFSAAGKGTGFDDERHLWPAFHHLIQECNPPVVFGEQVASKDAGPWIDLVHTDMEALGYAFGAIPFPAASVGAPHIRDRLYWVANNNNKGLEGRSRVFERAAELSTGAGGLVVGLADAKQHDSGCQTEPADHLWAQADRPADWVGGCSGASGGLGNAERLRGYDGRMVHRGCLEESSGTKEAIGSELRDETERASFVDRSGPVNGFWRDADWLLCRDEKWRPVRPGSFPLAHGVANRVGRLRAYGNAINAKAAQVFIESVMEIAA